MSTPQGFYILNADNYWYSGNTKGPLGGTIVPPSPSNPVYAGALDLGATNYTIPSSSVVFVDAANGSNAAAGTQAAPLKTVAAALATANSNIVLKGWAHESLNITKNISIIGWPGQVAGFDGSVVITGWTPNGNGTWTAPYTINLARISHSGYPLTSYPYGHYTDQIFVDGVQLQQTEDATTPASGQFSVDQNADTVTIYGNPAGKEIRATDLTTALTCSNVCNMYGIGIRRYAPQGMEGLNAMCYYGGTSQTSTVENCLFSDSAMAGFSTARNIIFNKNTIQNCGYSGIFATTASGVQITNNLMRNNNLGLWKDSPATGGIKVTRTRGCIITGNHISGMPGANGIWLDVSVQQYVIANNQVIGDSTMKTGVVFEECGGGFYDGVQYLGIFANNNVDNCISALAIAASGQTQLYNNNLTNSSFYSLAIHQDRAGNDSGNPASGSTYQENPWLCVNITVCNNKFTAAQYQFYSYNDYYDDTDGLDIVPLMSGNWFQSRPPGGNMVQWANIGGSRTTYQTPAALMGRPSLVGKGWNNYQGDTAPNLSIATALPADVALAIGVPTGTKAVGTFIDYLPIPIGST